MSRQISISEKCVLNSCPGNLKSEISERDVGNTFSYLYTLFDQKGQFLSNVEKSKQTAVGSIAEYINKL